jgi:transposase
MKRFVEGTDRAQGTLFPECLEDWVDENSPVRVIDLFVDELDLGEFGGSSQGSSPAMHRFANAVIVGIGLRPE